MTSSAEPSTRRCFTVFALGLFAVVLAEVAVAVIASFPAGLTWDEAVDAFVVTNTPSVSRARRRAY